MVEKAVPVSAYLEPQLFEVFKGIADKEDRSVSWLVGFAIKQFVNGRSFNARLKGEPSLLPKSPGQVDLEDAIVAAVKRGPVKTAKHK
jgi:hypothetical protein